MILFNSFFDRFFDKNLSCAEESHQEKEPEKYDAAILDSSKRVMMRVTASFKGDANSTINISSENIFGLRIAIKDNSITILQNYSWDESQFMLKCRLLDYSITDVSIIEQKRPEEICCVSGCKNEEHFQMFMLKNMVKNHSVLCTITITLTAY